MHCKTIALLIVVVGAINWGLVGAVNFNLVNYLFSSVPVIERIIYVVVGLAGIYSLYPLYGSWFVADKDIRRNRK